MVAGALPFLRRDAGDGVGADKRCGCDCGEACVTRCRLGLRADAGGSAAPWVGLVSVFVFRFRVLGGIGGVAVEETEAAAAVVGIDGDVWLAA
jgi:hypothetical protein